jgi:hypothetical protein
MGHHYLGTEHILLALLELEDGTGSLAGLSVNKTTAEGHIVAAVQASIPTPRAVTPLAEDQADIAPHRPASSEALSTTSRRRSRKSKFMEFCRYLRGLYPPGRRIAIVRDNCSPHLPTRADDRVGRWAAQNNVEIAYAPTNSSWLNRIKALLAALR